MSLQFGYNRGRPPGRTVAWGARRIVTQTGRVDLLHDTQHTIGPEGPRRRLIAHLNALEPDLRVLQQMLEAGWPNWFPSRPQTDADPAAEASA